MAKQKEVAPAVVVGNYFFVSKSDEKVPMVFIGPAHLADTKFGGLRISPKKAWEMMECGVFAANVAEMIRKGVPKPKAEQGGKAATAAPTMKFVK